MHQYYNRNISSTRDFAHKQQGEHILALDFFNRFLQIRMQDSELSPRTIEANLSEYRRYIVPYMQGVTLSDVTPQYLTEFYKYLHTQGGTKRTGISAGTVRHVHALISKAFNDAIDTGKLSYNPANRAKLPRRIRKEAYCLPPDEYKRLIDLTKNSRVPLAFALFLLAVTGMRRGELLALVWDDIDFICATISITKASGSTTKEVQDDRLYIREPKSVQSTRQLALDVNFLECVQAYKDAQAARLKRIGKLQTLTTPVIDIDGRAFDPDIFTHNAKVFFELFEFDRRLHVHSLRHSCISMLIRAGVDSKAVSAWAGHASIATTLDTYTHVFVGSKHETAGRLYKAYCSDE